MDSESARMSSAVEARFRVEYPNSKPRVVKVVALDEASERVVKRVAQRQWQRATFFTSIKFDHAPRSGESWSMQAWLSDLAGRTKALVEEVAAADLDDTFAKLQASDAEVIQEPTEQPYGVRDCAFRDPAGNHIRINELR